MKRGGGINGRDDKSKRYRYAKKKKIFFFSFREFEECSGYRSMKSNCESEAIGIGAGHGEALERE